MSVDLAGAGSASAQLGHLTEQVDKVARAQAEERSRSLRMQRAIHAMPLGSVEFLVASGSLVVPTAASLLGPEDGQVWDVRRITLAGWGTADAAINVNLFSELNMSQPSAQGNPQNRLRKFNDSAPGNETWAPGGGLVMHSPESLLITGTGFTAATTGIWLNLFGVAMEQWIEPDYLL